MPEDMMQEEPKKKKGFFSRLWSGLTKSRKNFSSGLNSIFHGFTKIDDEFYEELEEILIMGDLGVDTTEKILDELKDRVKEEKIREPEECRQILTDSIKKQMRVDEHAYDFVNRKSVVLVVGVNGVGKTTTIGKLAWKYKEAGKKVMLAAADTFRAAATEQLTTWAERTGVEIISGQEGADPGSVVFDAVSAAKSRGTDILLVDTAGRLHNKKNLMNELGKIYRIIEREYSEASLETFVVLDGTTGQNALAQAKSFNEAANITGIIMTKLDGTAKGGIAIAVQAELGVPVKYIGVGEQMEDLQEFDPDAYVDALFSEREETPDE
jgi:fused signal recognition particle receptor